jgi:MFS family permease
MTETSAVTGRVERLASDKAKPRLGWILALTSTAYFMVVLDSSVLITALPRMQRDLRVGLSSLQWTFNAYGIAFAARIITAAALGDASAADGSSTAGSRCSRSRRPPVRSHRTPAS